MAEIRDLIIRPCVLNYPNDSFVSQFILVKQIFELISDLFHLLIFPINQGSVSAFNYDGISSSAVASTGNAPKSRDAKKAYANYNDFDEDTLRRIGVFACIWTVGVCSQSSRVNFERWFREFFNDEVIKTRTRKIYPILESTISIFKYNLHRIEGTIPSLEWVQYESKVISSFQSTSLKHSPLHGNFHSPSTSSEHDLLISSGLYSLNQHEILVVNSEMKALAHVQAALSHTVYHALNNKNPKLTSKQRAVNGIHLFGECNTGKKSILHYLLQQMAYFSQSSTPNVHRGRSNQHSASSIECCRRWVLHANSSGHSYHTATLQAEILQSKRKLSTYLHEHNLPDYGALFIEDVCLDHPGNLNWKSYAQTPDQVHSHVSEVIRQTVEYQSVFDQVYQQFVSIPMFYAVMNSQSDRNPLHQHQKSYFDQIVGSSKGKLEKSGSTMGAPLGFSANFGMSAISNKESLRIETQEMPTDKYIQFHENSRNERILKHFISFNCNQEIIKDIFAIILSKNYLNASVTLELAKDIIALTHSYYQNLQKVIFELQQISPTSGSSNQNSDISPLSSRAPYYSFRENEKLLLQSLTCQPSLLWTQGTLYKLSAALSYLQFHSVGVTANDILRIWDRLINDINYRFPLVERMSDIFNYAFDDAVNSDSDPTQNYTYSFPSFVSILERERSIRLSNLENALTSYSSPQIDEAISYSRNCLGFFKTVSNSNETPTLANSSTSMLVGRKSITASTIMNAIGPYRGFPSLVSPIISTAEFLREVIFKQIMEKNLALRSISMDEAESNAPELQRLVEIEESYRKNKNNLSFWMDIFRFLNLLDVKPSQPAPLAEFPSNKTIIIMVSPSNVLHNGKLDRLKLASFHLQNSNLREIIIDQEIVEDYLFVSSSSSKRFHQNLYLATLENFFHDPYVIRSLQLFVRRMAKKKLSSPSVAGSRKGSAGSVVSPTQIHQLLEKARAAGNSILGIASSNNSSRRQSRVHPTSENLPFSISALMSSLQLEPNSKYQKRFEKLLNFIHAKLFSSNNSGNFTHNGEGSMDDCLTTIWWLKIDSHLSYELNQEINYNPLKNPSLLISMIKDLGIFESPLIEKFFIQLIHEDFELYLHEELRRLISKYSSHQKFVISIHDGTITPLGNLQEKRAVPAELFTPLFTSYSGSVQVLDLFPEKPPKIEQQDKLLRTASKIPSNEELKRFDAETPNSSRMSEGKGNEDWLNRLGVMQDYVRSLNQFIEKNKLIEKKFALSTANLYQYSRHLHKFLFEHLPDNISKDSVNKNENKGTKRLSINNMKERMNEMFSKLSLSHFNQDMIYNHHNNSTALTHLDQYHILTIVLLSIYSKSVLIKVNLVNDDPYAFSTTIPSLVEYLMKKDIFSLSAPEDTSSNMASSTNEVSRSSIAAPHLFIPYFQLFLSNLQIAFIGYLLNQFLLNPSLSFLDQTLLSTCLKQPPKRGRDIVKFYKKFWIFYQLSPKNTTLKHYLPNLLCSYYLYGKIVFKDSLIFASCSIISLLQLHTSLSNGLPFSLFHIENGKLLTELDSSVCMCHLYEFETAPIFEISKIDIPFFAEILVLSILSKGLLKSLAPELSSLFENLKTVIDNNWRSLESLIVPPSHQQRNSSEEDDDEDELADNEKPYYPSSSAHATFDEMVRYEELFHEATNSITQSLENLMILLSNLLLSVSSTITEEKLYVLFTEFWHIIEEQLEFSEQYLEVMEKRKKSNQKKKSLNQSNQHPIYSSLASIISFSILKFTIDVIPRYLSSETEFYHLLFSVVLDYFFGSYSNHTYENMAHFYRQKFLTQFHQLANFSSPIVNPVNASTIPTSTSKVPITPSAASPAHAATNLADGASHLKLKENNPLLHTILFNHARLDWKFGIIRKEQLNLPKLMKVTTEENTITPKSSDKKKNLKTITEDDISDLGSDSEEGNDNEENNNASDDHYILEDSYLSEFSKYLLKQSFTIISQFLNTGILGTFYSRYHSSSSSSSVKNRSSNNYYIINNLQKYSPLHNNAIHSYHTSISIINTIEKNIDEFMDWISNISLSVEALYENYHIFFSPLEELIFIAIMKPILFPQTLLHHYYLFGLNLNFQRFSDIQSILLQQKIIRQNLNLLLPSKENSIVQIKYGNYDDYNQIFSNPYMMSGNMSSLLDYTHHRIFYKLQQKRSRLEISNSAIKINADQKSLNGIDDASIGSGESNNEKSTITISSTGLNSIQPLRKRKQSLTDSKRSLSSGEFSNRGNVISLSFPRQYFPHQLILFLQHQFHHLDRDWIRSLSSNKESSQSERLFNLTLLGNSFSTNSTVMLPHYLTNSHHFSGWSGALQRFSSIGWEELNQRLLSKNWKIFVNIPSKSFHRYFPEQYFYHQDIELSSSSSQVLPISSDFLGSYHFAFSEAFFLLMLSSLISAVTLTKDEVLRISPAAAGSIVVSSRYSKFYYFLQQQYTLTTSTAASVSSNATGTSSLLLLLQTGNDVSSTITIQQIHEIYADCLHLLFSRMRYLFIFSHFSILYYYRYVTTLTVIGSTSSVLINNYPHQSTVLSLLSSTECLLQGIEMMENLFLQQLMLVVENEVKRYHDYQRFMQVNNNAAVLNALNNNSSTNNSFQTKTPQELIQQSLAFLSENKMIHSLLYSLYYSKLSSSSILASGFGGSKDYHFIKLVLQSFFSPLSLNYQFRYLLLNQVKIPSTFQLFEIEEFLRKMVLLFNDNAEDPENQLDADEDSEDESEPADEEADEDNEEKDAKEKGYDNNSHQETKQKEQSVMNSRRSTALKSSPKHVIKNHQNENLICDLLFINPNFLFIKYFYLVQQISQESIYQSAIQQFIENNHYDEATTPHYNVPSNNSATAGVASSGNMAQKSSDNTAPNSGHNSRRPSAATASAHSTNPAAHHRGTSSGTTLKTNYYYQILQMKSFCSNHFFLLIQQSLHQFYRKLSSIQKISWKNNKEAMKQMKEHSLTDMKIGSNNKGGGGGGSVSGGSSVVGGSNYRRRFGQRIILRFQSREYDSLWAFLLLEIYQFNKYYSIMMKYFFSFLHNYSSYDTWIEYFQQFYLQHPFLYQHHLHFQSRPNATSSSVSSPLPSMTTEMLMHQQADIIHSLYLNCMIQLSQQCIPSIWLHYHDSIFTSVVNCSMDQWHQTILEQRQMLWQWLIDGKPSNISLYLLYNPSGLFYALRETFALKTDTIVDKVFLHYEVIPLILHQQEQFYYYYQHQQELLQTAHPVPPPSSLSPNASSSPRRSRKQLQQQQQTVRSPVAVNTSNTDPASGNTLAEAMSIASVFVANYDQVYITGSMGCYVHLTNITFMNALFSARSNMMEFMPFHAVSPHGSVSESHNIRSSLNFNNTW